MKSNYYNHHAKEIIENTVNVNMSSLYQRFISYLPEHSKVLDAGCGSGRDSLAFMEMGYSVDAFDASFEMVKFASRLTGILVKQHTFDQLQEVNTYDGIWCCASLLHVPRNNLVASMQKIAEALKNNGIWYVSFKYGENEREKDGRHFTDLTENSLDELVNEITGIKVQEIWTTADKRTDNTVQWVNALLSKSLK